MTILEWMKASTRYTFEDITLEAIAAERQIAVSDELSTLSVQNKELLQADMIFTAVVLSPSSIPSQSVMHNNFQKTIGAETDIYQSQKINFAKAIYKKYGDSKFDTLNSIKKGITIIPIEDII